MRVQKHIRNAQIFAEFGAAKPKTKRKINTSCLIWCQLICTIKSHTRYFSDVLFGIYLLQFRLNSDGGRERPRQNIAKVFFRTIKVMIYMKLYSIISAMKTESELHKSRSPECDR